MEQNLVLRCRSKIADAKASACASGWRSKKKASLVAVLLPTPGNLANSATSRAKDGMESNIIYHRNSTVYEILKIF
jgi:hypothetical protein